MRSRASREPSRPQQRSRAPWVQTSKSIIFEDPLDEWSLDSSLVPCWCNKSHAISTMSLRCPYRSVPRHGRGDCDGSTRETSDGCNGRYKMTECGSSTSRSRFWCTSSTLIPYFLANSCTGCRAGILSIWLGQGRGHSINKMPAGESAAEPPGRAPRSNVNAAHVIFFEAMEVMKT